jgi:hypothetical protein
MPFRGAVVTVLVPMVVVAVTPVFEAAVVVRAVVLAVLVVVRAVVGAALDVVSVPPATGCSSEVDVMAGVSSTAIG